MAHPAFPTLPSGRSTKHIFAFFALTSDAAADRLITARQAEWKRKGNTSKAQTLTAAITALERTIREDVREAKKDGELLFCWHGTKAFEVAA